MKHPKKKAVIFDFDGTIADSLPAVIQVFEELTKRPQTMTHEQVQTFRDMNPGELMKALEVPKWKLPILMFRGKRMLTSHLHGIAICKGMPELLDHLQQAGIPMYVLSSNTLENINSYLRRNHLHRYFGGIYGGASFIGKAPRLLKMIDKEHIDIEGSWYVGDETRDVSAARAVGLKIASVTWGYNTAFALETKDPDVLVHNTKELEKVLMQAWKK